MSTVVNAASLASATETAHGAYAARDVVDAPAVKAAILRRSTQRADPPEIAQWMANHFYRHVVGNLQAEAPALQPLTSSEQARGLFAPAPLPDWVAARLKSATGAALWWIDPHSAELLALESRLLEFLGSRQGTPLEGKLMRVNAPQALALWSAEHAAFEARSSAGWREHQPAAVQTVWQGAQGNFVELRAESPELRAEMAYESQMMRHCLGQFASRRRLEGGYGEQYAAACEAGRLRLFSFRTGQQQPHITISAILQPDDRWTIDQIKGKQNRPPIARYRDEVLGFLNTLDTSDVTPPDAAAMGLVRLERGWLAVSEIRDPTDQLRIAHLHPALIRDMVQPSALAQWLVAARQPALLRGLALAPGVARALAARP